MPIPDHVREQTVPDGAETGLLNWLGEDNVQVDAKKMEQNLQVGRSCLLIFSFILVFISCHTIYGGIHMYRKSTMCLISLY